VAFLDNIFEFIASKTPLELLRLFWYFILFDFTRYVLSDIFFLTYFLFKGSERKNREMSRERLYAENPLITVIAPGKNEGAHLDALAISLMDQTYKNLEVIIVDDGSDDDTPEVGRRLLRQGKIHKFFRNEIRGGKASAANFGLRYAKGKYIVHLDADSNLKRDSIEKIIIPFYMDSSIGAVAGDIHVKNLYDSFATIMQGIEYLKTISLSRIINSKLGILRIVSGAFGAFRMDLLQRLGGWDVGPGLDGDITIKIRKLKYQIWFEPSAVCYTNVPKTFTALAKQRYRWDRSLVRFRLRKHIDIIFPSKGFNIYNFISLVENVLYNFVFNIKWWAYTIWVVIFNVSVLKYIVVINYFLYLVSNFIEFTVTCIVLHKTLRMKELMLMAFIPLVPIYNGFFLRMIRTYAHLMELFFKMSYEDKWNPWKVSKHARDNKL
jgi:cellulose synthase/poly-beta-1,6-N-acetylglucosamine synthase-like glycosyltransferase